MNPAPAMEGLRSGPAPGAASTGVAGTAAALDLELRRSRVATLVRSCFCGLTALLSIAAAVDSIHGFPLLSLLGIALLYRALGVLEPESGAVLSFAEGAWRQCPPARSARDDPCPEPLAVRLRLDLPTVMLLEFRPHAGSGQVGGGGRSSARRYWLLYRDAMSERDWRLVRRRLTLEVSRCRLAGGIR